MNRILTASVLAFAITVGACGGGDGSPSSPRTMLAAALKHAESTKSYRSTVDMTSDLDNEKFAISGEVRSTGDSSRLRGTFNFAEGGEPAVPMEMILIGDEGWYRGKTFDEILPPGREWMYMKDEELGQQSLTPEQFVDLLRDTPEIEEVGREDVRGASATHLRGPIDLQEAADRVGSGPLYELVKKSPGMVERMDATIDAWIDEEDRLRRVGLVISVQDAPGKMEMTADFLEEDVSLDDVKPPPSELVADIKDIQGG
jgi:hypothetical protein